MNKRTRKFAVTLTHLKILETINYLNEKHYYPLPQGVRKILMGEEDEETLMFKDSPTYATLISYPSKKISRYVMMLQRYHYLGKKYDSVTDKLYLEITDLGKSTLLEHSKKHKKAYKKKSVTKATTIVYID